VQSDAEKFVAAKADLDRTDIAAPSAGQVVGLAMQTVGGVVQPGQKIMDIVPVGEALLLEARIETHLIDKVKAGLPTDVRFSAFSHTPQLVVDAQVVSVSRDALTDPQSGIGFYLARIQVTPQGMKTLGSRQMQPGMPVEVVIKTGERSLLTYLLNPLIKRVAASMKEE
jgi:protease secretion system membrane fusion protein